MSSGKRGSRILDGYQTIQPHYAHLFDRYRAIEIIDELEPADRGIYGGTVGYFDFSGNLDMAIAIRTAFIRDHEASVQAGAGIVLDSVPASEWQETRNKAEASVEAVQIASQLRQL